MAGTRRIRTPEEIAAAKARAREVMDKQKQRDGLDEIKRGRTFIFVTAGLFLASSLIFYFQTRAIELYYFFGPLIALYIILGIYYYRNPLIISWIALGIYGLIIISDAVLDPTTIFAGIIWKVLIITALVSAIKSAIKYRDELSKMKDNEPQEDILDEEMIS